MKGLHYIRRFWQIPKMERKILIMSIITSFIAFILIHSLSVKHYRKLFIRNRMDSINETKSDEYLNIIKLSMKRLGQITPWELSCLNKCITFKIISNTLNIDCSITFNVVRSNYKLYAHAYISRNDRIVYLNKPCFKYVKGLLTL